MAKEKLPGQTERFRRRVFMSMPDGVQWWESECGFGPQEAATKLGLPLRTYHRYKAEGLPAKLQREVILDRMEAALPRKRGG